MPAFGKSTSQSADQLENHRQERGLDDNGQPLDRPAPEPSVAPSAPVAQRPAPTNRFLRSNAGVAPAPAAQRPATPPASAPAPVTQRPAAQPASAPAQRPGYARSSAPAPEPSVAQQPVQTARPPVESPRPAPAQAPTPSRPSPSQAPAGQRPATQASSGRPAAQPSQSSRPLPRNVEEPATEPARAPANAAARPTEAAKAVADLFSGYTAQVREMSRRADGLPLRLERLIDEISDFGNVTPQRREEAKLRALNSPDRAQFERDLMAYYRDKVVPARKNTAVSIEDAQQKNPGKAVFLLLKGKDWSAQVLDPEVPEEQGMLLLNGASVEVVSASRTPFREPSIMFGRQAMDTTMEVEEDAFGEPSEGPGRAPRP